MNLREKLQRKSTISLPSLPDNHNFKHSSVPFDEIGTESMEYGRGYVIGDKIYPSITTVLGAEENIALTKWREKVGEEEAEKISRRATHKGTGVHELCEKYLNNELTSYDGYDFVQIESFLKIQPILAERVNNIIAQETPLFTHKYRTAGRVDLIGEFDKIPSIIDFKTSNNPKEESWIEKYFVQETAYAIMLYEMKGIKLSQIVTIITVENDEPQIFIKHPKDYFDKFLKIRKLFFQKHGV